MLKDFGEWARQVFLGRKPERLPDLDATAIKALSVQLETGESDVLFVVRRPHRNLVAGDFDGFVALVAHQFDQRYGDLPKFNILGDNGDKIATRVMPATITVSPECVTCVLAPCDEHLEAATHNLSLSSTEPDVIRLPLTPTWEWERLLQFQGGTRATQAEFLQDWVDVWVNRTLGGRSVEEKLRKIEIVARTEVQTSARRDQGVSEFRAGDDELPEFVTLSIHRWMQHPDYLMRSLTSSLEQVETRLVIERKSPPQLALTPRVMALANAERKAIDGLVDRLAADPDIEQRRIVVVAGKTIANG